jgi:hypothetical protein
MPMKLHRGYDVVPNGTGRVYRQSRVRSSLLLVVYSAIFLGSPLLLWWHGAPAVVWGTFGLSALLFVPLMLSDIPLRFRRSNWVLWVREGSLWVNLRSYQYRGPRDSLSVLELADRDVREIWQHSERYTVPMGRRSVGQSRTTLELLLARADAGSIADALNAGRRGQPRGSQVTVYSVLMPAPDRLRIIWSDRGQLISPSLKRLMAELETRIKIGEPTRDDRPDGRTMTAEGVDDQIIDLVATGNRLGAIQLLTRRRNLSLTEAEKFIAELAQTQGESRDV